MQHREKEREWVSVCVCVCLVSRQKKGMGCLLGEL